MITFIVEDIKSIKSIKSVKSINIFDMNRKCVKIITGLNGVYISHLQNGIYFIEVVDK